MLTRWNDFGALGRHNPRDLAGSFDALDDLRREMNRLFFDYERWMPGGPTEGAARVWPRAVLEDTGSALVLRAEVPGVQEKDLELKVDESTVSLKGERAEANPEGYSVHRKERAAYRFARSFALPTKVDSEQAEAVLKHGVLTVTLPKAKEAQPRQISVRSS